MVETFINAVQETTDPSLRLVLKKLSDLFALYYLEKDLVEFVEDGYFQRQHGDFVRQKVRQLLDELRYSDSV
jgi:hypothetical protein